MRRLRLPARQVASRSEALLRRLPAVVLSALFAHAVVYRSLWPADGAHGYFAWYAPLVAVLSVIAMVAVPAVLAVAILHSRRDNQAARAARIVLPHGGGLSEAARLASGSLAFLVAQEAMEHSLQSRQLALPALSASAWLIVTATLVCVAAMLTWVADAIAAVLESLCAGERLAFEPVFAVAARSDARHARRPRPLAVHGALRGPPFTA